jgi:UvrD-like helicase family protein
MAYTRQYRNGGGNGYRNYKGGGATGHKRGGGGYGLTPVTREQVMASLPPASGEQLAIVNHLKTGRRDLIVDAKAGSGKTTTCKFMAAALTSDNALYCVFSKALELEIKPQLFGLLEIKTSYALGLESVRSVIGDKLSLAGRNAIQEDKYKKLVKVQANMLASQARMAFDAKPEDERILGEKPPGDREIYNVLVALVQHCQMNLVSPSDLEAVYDLCDHHNVELPCELEILLPVVKGIFDEGIRMAKQDGIISFGDMVWLPHVWNIDPPRKFLYVMVDEAQDINAAQRELLLKLRAPGGMMVWVGDKRQAIFGFASADANSFETIRTQTGASELPLNTCYRCPTSAIALAQTIVPEIVAAPDAPAGLVADCTESELIGMVQEGDMVLCRLTAPLITTCLAMIAKRVPARVKGKDVGKTITSFVEQVANQPGYGYKRFPEFLDRLVQKLVGRLSRREGNEGQIELVMDKAEAIMICYNNFVDCEETDDLVAAIDDLFTEDRPGVTLSTIHRAKGLEAERIFILRPEKLPLVWKNQPEWCRIQEMNLKYVAITRVKFNRKTGFEGALYFVRG